MKQTVKLLGLYIGYPEESVTVECGDVIFKRADWKVVVGASGTAQHEMTRPAEIKLLDLGAGKERLGPQWSHIEFTDENGQAYLGTIKGRPELVPDGVRIVLHPVEMR